jgi:hypothetical protein
LNYLIEQNRFEDAAKLCVKIFGRNKELWEAEAYKFAKMGQLKVSCISSEILLILVPVRYGF